MDSAAEGFLTMLETLAPLKDAIDGYREDWIRRGYSPTAAEAMAMDLHHHMIGAMFAAGQAAKRG